MTVGKDYIGTMREVDQSRGELLGYYSLAPYAGKGPG
jgi:hypothetical protein